jgi:hypothetical protein
MKVLYALVLVLFAFNVSHSQSKRTGGSAKGSLTVTATTMVVTTVVAQQVNF